MPVKNREDILRILREQLPHLSSRYGVKQIGLFGSFSRSQQHDSSDVDVVVEFERPIGLKFVDFADYLENIQVLDRKVGAVLERLEEDGLLDTTAVFFFSDHGRPHVRGKQWLYERPA